MTATPEQIKARGMKKAAADLARAKRLRDTARRRYDATHYGLFATATELSATSSALRDAEGAVVHATSILKALL